MVYPIKCFLIDDDEDEQEIFGMALQDLDICIQLEYAMSTPKAITILKNVKMDYMPDCIFIDLNMPIFNGLVCLQEIKKIDRLHNIPVFIYSTLAESKMVHKAKTLGAADFIVKPANISHLTETLRTILSNIWQSAAV